MDTFKTASTASILFSRAHDANRRIAGVAAAGRIVRELAEAGFTEAWLVVRDAGGLAGSTMDDVGRLAGAMAVHIGEPPPEHGALQLPGDRLIPAAALSALRAGHRLDDSAGLPLGRADAGWQILRSTGKAGDGPVSRWINRPISRRLSALLLLVPGVRPVHATLGTALLAAAMFIALIAGGPAGLVAGALLFQAASIFDGVDGEIARATFRSSRRGAALDSFVDAATNLLLVLGVAINLTLRGQPEAMALAGWGLALFVLGVSLIAWQAAGRAGHFSLDLVKHHYRGRFAGSLVPRLMALGTIVTSRDFFALLFAVLIVAGFPLAVLYLFSVSATVWMLFVLGSLLPARRPAAASDDS